LNQGMRLKLDSVQLWVNSCWTEHQNQKIKWR